MSSCSASAIATSACSRASIVCARAHQRVGKRERAGCGVGTQLADGAERLNRFVQPSHAQQQRAELIVDGGELGVRVDDRLQRADAGRVFLLTDEHRRRAVRVDGRLLRRRIERGLGGRGLRKRAQVAEQRVALLVARQR